MSRAEINVAEQFRRIEQLVADADARNAERLKADRDWKFSPWQLLGSGLTAGAAAMAAAAVALVSLLH